MTWTIEAVERLLKLKAALPVPRKSLRLGRIAGILVTVLSAALLFFRAYMKRSTTSVELEVRASRIELQLTDKRASLLIPGELGEVLALSSAQVAGVDEVDPLITHDGGELHLRSGLPRPIHRLLTLLSDSRNWKSRQTGN